MKKVILYRESDDFDDFDADPVVQDAVLHKVSIKCSRIIYLDPDQDQIETYISIKYGESICLTPEPDFSPVPGVDYVITKKRKSV
jgi:hypothetical protein